MSRASAFQYHIITFLILMISGNLQAQKSANTWYFSNSRGIDFNSGSPVLLTTSGMNEYEGCSATSDPATGAILIYTDGMKVWGKNHLVMPNGSGLISTYAAGQQGLVVPYPGNPNKYYVFTSGEYYSSGVDGYRYNIVDLTLNGGVGDVTATKNILLYAPASEKLCAIKKSDGNYWVATHHYSGNTFEIFELTTSGISAPVISSIGTPFSSVNPDGCMKFSPDGKKIALTLGGSNKAEYFDFDVNTGFVSNPVSLGPIAATFPYTYGISFSPNSKRLYVTEENDKNLYQFNLEAGTPTEINNSKVAVGSTSSYAVQTCQLAPDGKMYVARNGGAYLAVVNNPDEIGLACNFTDNGFYLSGGASSYGLPNFPEELFSNSVLLAPEASFNSAATQQCLQTCVNFTDASSNNPTLWLWSFPGANPSSSTQQNPTGICYNVAGDYDVTLTASNANGSDSYTSMITISIYAAVNASITQSNDTLYAATANSYQWYTNGNPIGGATNNYYVPSAEGAYVLVATDAYGCSASDTIDFVLSPFSNFTANQLICQKFCIDFFDLSKNNPTFWKWLFEGGSPSSSSLQNPVSICYNSAGQYDVTLIIGNAYGNDTLIMHDFITVFATPALPVITQNGYTLTCSAANSYQWQLNSVDISGATNQSYEVTQTGYYTVVTSDDNGCLSSSTVYILISNTENIFTGNEWLIYPNPSDGNFSLEWISSIPAGKAAIKVINALGQIIYSEETTILQHSKKDISLEWLPSGIYFLHIVTNNNTFIYKLNFPK